MTNSIEKKRNMFLAGLFITFCILSVI